MTSQKTELTLGPVLFNWAPELWRDFYFRIADEATIETVIVGEVVCSKRTPFFAEHIPAVVERLQMAGKQVVLASPILATTERERDGVRELVATAGDFLIEANDMGCVAQLSGKPHWIGPFVNVYNEATLAWMARRGASSISLAGELTETAISALAKAAAPLGVDLEVQVFGRLPLAISVRCYHARAHGLHKDNCRYVCNEDPDGLSVDTLDGAEFLSVNGLQTLSHTYVGLTHEIATLKALGIRRLRLSPHSSDMVAVAALFRNLADGRLGAAEARIKLLELAAPAKLCNGFFHDREGVIDTAAV